MAKPKGWVKEPVRHGLAAKGVKTAVRPRWPYTDSQVQALMRKAATADALAIINKYDKGMKGAREQDIIKAIGFPLLGEMVSAGIVYETSPHRFRNVSSWAKADIMYERLKKTRKFNGKTYQLWSIHRRKVDAQATAAATPLYHARVVPALGEWAVYRRKKQEYGR